MGLQTDPKTLRKVAHLPGREGRPFRAHTKLGRLMIKRGVGPWDVCIGTGVYVRSMSAYLAGDYGPGAKTLGRLCEYFQVPEGAIRERKYPYTNEMAAEDEAKREAAKALGAKDGHSTIKEVGV